MCNNFRGVSLKWTLLDAIDLKMIKNKILYIFLGLRRRSLGLFKTTCSSALLNKISKECSDAAHVIKRWVKEIMIYFKHTRFHILLLTFLFCTILHVCVMFQNRRSWEIKQDRKLYKQFLQQWIRVFQIILIQRFPFGMLFPVIWLLFCIYIVKKFFS